MSLSAEGRRKKITKIITNGEKVKVSELAEMFNISEVSIRRDLNKLQGEGLLKRTHGGAMGTARIYGMQSFREKMEKNLEEKRRIAAKAVEMIDEGNSIILAPGTTALQIASKLGSYQNLTVVTSCLPIAEALMGCQGVNLVLVGGEYQPEFMSLVGPLTVKYFKEFNVDTYFMGVDGLTISQGLTATNFLQAEVCRAMIQASQRVIVTADYSKIGKISFVSIAPVEVMEKLITDSKADGKTLESLRENGVEVFTV